MDSWAATIDEANARCASVACSLRPAMILPASSKRRLCDGQERPAWRGYFSVRSVTGKSAVSSNGPSVSLARIRIV